MPVWVGQQMPLREQLPDHRQPPGAVEFCPDAKRLDPVMAELPDSFGRVADQHIGDMLRPESLPGAIDRRQRLLRRDRAVPARRRAAAIVAIAARQMIALAE